MSSLWWVYIIKTGKSHYYTGITTDVDRRFQQHADVSAGKKSALGAKFFRSDTPVRVVHRESFSSRSEATKREIEIKKMTHNQKVQLIKF